MLPLSVHYYYYYSYNLSPSLSRYGASIPGGMFMPSILIGGMLGGACYHVSREILPAAHPQTIALLGAVAYVTAPLPLVDYRYYDPVLPAAAAAATPSPPR